MSEEIGATQQRTNTLKLKSFQNTKPVQKTTSTQNTEQPQTARTAKEVLTRNLNEQTNKLNTLLDGIAHSSNIIKTTNTRLDGIQMLLETAKKLTETAVTDFQNGTADTNKYAQEFSDILVQINNLAQKIENSEENLLQGGSLTTILHTGPYNTITTQGALLDTSSLGLENADLTSENGIKDFLGNIQTALQNTYSFRASLNGAQTKISDQLNFTQGALDTYKTSTSQKNSESSADEAANLLALQTRHILSSNANIPLASESQQGILRLF